MSQLAAEIKYHMRYGCVRVCKHAVTRYQQTSHIKSPNYVEMIYKCDSVPLILVKPAAVPLWISSRKKVNKKYVKRDGVDSNIRTRVIKVAEGLSWSEWKVMDDQVCCKRSNRPMERDFGTEGLVRMGDG